MGLDIENLFYESIKLLGSENIEIPVDKTANKIGCIKRGNRDILSQSYTPFKLL